MVLEGILLKLPKTKQMRKHHNVCAQEKKKVLVKTVEILELCLCALSESCEQRWSSSLTSYFI